MEAIGLAYIVLGLIAGGSIGWMFAKQKMTHRVSRAEAMIEAREAALTQSEDLIRAQTKVMTTDAAKEINDQQIKPFEKRMEDMAKIHTELEKNREGAYPVSYTHLRAHET